MFKQNSERYDPVDGASSVDLEDNDHQMPSPWSSIRVRFGVQISHKNLISLRTNKVQRREIRLNSFLWQQVKSCFTIIKFQ